MTLCAFALKYYQTIEGFNAEMLLVIWLVEKRHSRGTNLASSSNSVRLQYLQNIWLFKTSGLFRTDALGDTEA